jgi:putative nucleotidyltransferase with HDIG domain
MDMETHLPRPSHIQGRVDGDPEPSYPGWIHEVTSTLANALEAKHSTSYDHCDQTADIAAQIASQIGLMPQQTDIIRVGAKLHDIGKLGIPKSVLDKPGPLTTQEWALIKQHPVIGARIISPLSAFQTQGGRKGNCALSP